MHELKKSDNEIGNKNFKIRSHLHRKLSMKQTENEPLKINTHPLLSRSFSVSNNMENIEELLFKYGLYKTNYTNHFPVDEKAVAQKVIQRQSSNSVSPTNKDVSIVHNANAFEKIKNSFYIPESEETINIILNLKTLTSEGSLQKKIPESSNLEASTLKESSYQYPTKNELPIESAFNKETPTTKFKTISKLFKKKDKNNLKYYGEQSILSSLKSLQTLYIPDSQLNDDEQKHTFECWNCDQLIKKPIKLQAKSEQNISSLYRRNPNFLSSSVEFLRDRVHETKYVTAVFESANNGLGPILEDIEKEFSHWLGVKSRLLVVACEVHWSVPECYRSRIMEIE